MSMTEKEWAIKNHEIIESFLTCAKDNPGTMSKLVTCTIAQFLLNLKINYHIKSLGHNGLITWDDLINGQIEELRSCVIELQALLNQSFATQ